MKASKNLRKGLIWSLAAILLFLIVFEASSLFFWLILPLSPSLFYNKKGFASWIVDTEGSISNSLNGFSPFFVLILMFSWIPYLLRKILRWTGYLKDKHSDSESSLYMTAWNKISKLRMINGSLDSFFKISMKKGMFVLIASIVLAFAVAFYPYHPSLNPYGRFVGVDIPFYSQELMEAFKLGDLGEVAHYFLRWADRPLSLFVLFLGWRSSGFSALQAVQFSSMLLAPILVLVTYFFAQQMGLKRTATALTCLFTAFSFHVTVAMFGGLLANLIALIFFYLYLGFLFISLRKKSWSLLVVAGVFQAALLFSHAQSWGLSAGILGVYLFFVFIDWLKNRGDNSAILMLFVMLMGGVFLNFLRNYALGTSLEKIEVVSVATENVSFSNLANIMYFLSYTIGGYMGISFINPTMWLFACLGGFAASSDDKMLNRFLMACVMPVAVPFIFGNEVVQARILYDLPIHLFALIGILFLTKSISNVLEREEAKKINALLLILVVLINLNYVFRSSFYLTQTWFFPIR